mgnify:FL=1
MKIFIWLKSRFCQVSQRACTTAIITRALISKRSVLAPCIIAIVFAFIGQQGRACMMNISGVNFGSYDVFSNASSDSTGNIDVN